MNKRSATFLGSFLAYLGLLLFFVAYLCCTRIGHPNSRLFRYPVFRLTTSLTFQQVMAMFAAAICCLIASVYITRKYVRPYMPPLSDAELERKRKWRMRMRYLSIFHIIIVIILAGVILSKSHA